MRRYGDRNGKFPPGVDVAPYLRSTNKPVVVVPLYRLEAWQAGERMPNILQEVFEFRSLHEPPWGCYVARKRAIRDDIAFWVNRRGFDVAKSKDGRRIYGEGLEEVRLYELVSGSKAQ